MTYFDFHLHPVFKKYICKFEENYPSSLPVENILGEMDLKNVILDFADENILHILQSQSCIKQLQKGNFKLGVAGIAPIEAIFVEKEGIFGKILNSSIFTKPVDQKYFDKIREREISYYQLFIRELNLYKTLRESKMVRMLNRQDQIPAGDDGICLTLGMEGGHALSRCKIRRPGVADNLSVISGKEDEISRDFVNFPLLSAAESLRHLQQAMWREGLDLCYLILTHLSFIPEQPLATHAFGMKMIQNTGVFPRGNGLTDAGKDVIDAAYSLKVEDNQGNEVAAPVLLDIKHMGLKTRLDFYEYRRKNKYDRFPILATHMGVTGFSIEEWKAALEKAELKKEGDVPLVEISIDRKRAGEWGVTNKTFTYNAWSINLMDEDIEEVLKSDGLIGISLDVRILGWQDIITKGDKEELMSWEDFRFHFPERAATLSKGQPGFEESFFVPTKEERHPLAICFNILHIVWVGKTFTDVDPWKHVCIGSDFDGLINPMINCRDAERLPNLERQLRKWMPVAEKAYCKENDAIPLLPRKNGAVDGDAFTAIVEGIMYNNGKRFLDNWVNRNYE